MEINVDFNPEDWDVISDTSGLHFSNLIQTLLPIRLVGWKCVKRHYDGAVAGMQASKLEPSDTFIVTGSLAEGLGIPFTITRTNPPRLEKHADSDVLWVMSSLKISTKSLSDTDTDEYKGYFDSKGLHPGYTRICLPSIKCEDEVFIRDPEQNKYFLSGAKLVEKVFSSRQTWNLALSEESWVQGPALTIVDNTEVTMDNFKIPNIGGSRDLVLALPCFPWPEEAAAWRKRAQHSQWLDSALVDSIIADGCHVVAVPSKNSTNPDIEWRISFSASEGRLAREAITDHQRQCYVYMKMLRNQVMKTEPILSSYVFKSVFLHCCEQLPVDSWKSTPGACVLYMLDLVLDCLEKRHVPTYFLPENNLISHLSDEELLKAKSFVSKLRADPITPVLEFTDTRVFGLQNTFATFRELVKPLLDDMSQYKQHRNKDTSVLKGILATSNQICHYLLYEQTGNEENDSEKYKEAVRCLIDVYENWLQPMSLNATLLQVINAGGLAVKDLDVSLRFFRAVVNLADEYPEFKDARGILACLCHSAAYIHPEGSDKRKEYLNAAGQLFKQIYDENKTSAIDFVAYLFKQGKFEEAITIVDDIIANKKADSGYSYDSKEANVLPQPLKQHVEREGKLAGDAVAFAYFYKIMCVLATREGDTEETAQVLTEFEQYCQESNDDNAVILFSYAMQECFGK